MHNEELAPPHADAKLGGWFAAGVRSALFQEPELDALRPTPGIILGLIALVLALGIVLQRLALQSAAQFYWQAVASGWLAPLVTLWVCWLVSHRASASGGSDDATRPRSAGTLFGVLLAQSFAIGIAIWLPYLALLHGGTRMDSPLVEWLLWGLTPLMMVWSIASGARLLWPHTRGHAGLRWAVLGGLLASAAVKAFVPATPYWYTDASAESERAPRFQLTQDSFEWQASAFDRQLRALVPQRQGVVDLYAVTFAPYAGEDVFLRESRMVADVMRQRFDADGRVVNLVNHALTAAELPWATPSNLQRTIAHVAGVMNKDEDVLFIHLTSHGARDGQLAASFWPLSVTAVDPKTLKGWLDEAGVRHRVISVSACYSGTWLEPLRDAGTLVMTASDAEHTSYGCGRKSELTYFGRAMYDEQLRTTRSFETAHQAARAVIEAREKQAGKSDGYSNPQLHMGAAVRERLAALESRLAAKRPAD